MAVTQWETVDSYIDISKETGYYMDTSTIIKIRNKRLLGLEKIVLNSGDKESSVIKFEMPRYINGIDLSDSNYYIYMEGKSYLNDGTLYSSVRYAARSTIRSTSYIRFMVPIDGVSLKHPGIFKIQPYIVDMSGGKSSYDYILKMCVGKIRVL